MDRYHRFGHSGSEGRQSSSGASIASERDHLLRLVRQKHAKHVMNYLFRAAVLGSLIVFGLQAVDSPWGTALAITAGFLSLHTLLYAIRGHWTISRFRKARLYWLQDATVDQDVSPVFLASRVPDLFRKSA